MNHSPRAAGDALVAPSPAMNQRSQSRLSKPAWWKWYSTLSVSFGLVENDPPTDRSSRNLEAESSGSTLATLTGRTRVSRPYASASSITLGSLPPDHSAYAT